MSFVWSVPSMTANNQKSLCYGYIRNNYTNFMATDIMGLCTTFYSPTFYTLRDIKNAQNFPKYMSPIFHVDQFKCYLEFWPNGCDEQHKGKVLLVLCFVGFPPKIKEVRSKFTLAVAETGTWFIRPERTFTKTSMLCSWKPNLLTIDKLKDTETLTIVCGIHELVIREKGKFRRPTTFSPRTSHIYTLNNLQTLDYIWDIGDISSWKVSKNVYALASPIFEVFGLKWYLTFYPNGSKIQRKGHANVYLHLASIPSPDITVWIRQRLSFYHNVEELILRHTDTSDGHGLAQFVRTEDVIKSNGLCCHVEITLIDVVDKDTVVTDTFINGNNSIDDVKNISNHFEWIMKPIDVIASEVGDTLKSDMFIMFGFEWCLGMDSNGKVYLNLLTKKWKEREVVSVRCFVAISELNIRWVLKGIFHKNKLSVNWGNDRISMDEFTNYTECHMLFEMELVDA